ncbi:hypothetical protein AB0J79_18615 [Rhodococcus coprophilus]|uniref:hypothetical protein n=1 Tax=Rhodococcus coprophilus TaxID=38310 RepID=UPI0034477D98
MTDDLGGATPYDFPRYYEEKDRRRALVNAMPGRNHQAHFENLNRAYAILEGNRQELELRFQSFVQSTQYAGNLSDEYKQELVRLFHNYLAAVGSLRDIQRTIHRKLWPEKDESNQDDGDGSNQKTIWEETVYQPKVQEYFSTDEFSFLQNLRNYTLHYSLPVPAGSTTLSWGQDRPLTHENRLLLRSSSLLKYKKWPGPAKRFLREQAERFEFHPIIERYAVAVEKFFHWFNAVVLEKLSPEHPDYISTATELEYWVGEYQIVVTWKQDQQGQVGLFAPPSEERNFRRELAELKQRRWAYGSRGWRIFTVTPDGEVDLLHGYTDPWGLPRRSPRIPTKVPANTPPDADTTSTLA